jgi:hypothetical protein
MRSAVLDLSWYQYFLLDVIAVITLTVGFIIVTAFLVFSAVFRRVSGSSSNNVIGGNKKKN